MKKLIPPTFPLNVNIPTFGVILNEVKDPVILIRQRRRRISDILPLRKLRVRMTENVKVSLSAFVTVFLIMFLPHSAHAALPTPWVNTEIGTAVTSSADLVNNQFTISARGIDIGGNSDTFDFVNQLFSGDVELIAKVESLGTATATPKAGLMIRETLTKGSKNVMIALNKGSATTFQRRNFTDGSTSSGSGAVVSTPYWVKLVRRGNNFYGYQSPDGSVWTQVSVYTNVTMAANAYVGLALTSKNSTVTNNVVFSKVSVRPATAPLPPVLNTAKSSGQTQVDLSWSASDRATSYKVKRGTTSGSNTTTLTLGNVTSTTVTGLTNGTTYYFVVTAVNEYGESTKSNEKAATPLEAPTLFIKKIDYNAMGQKTRIEYGNGVVTTNTYDDRNLRLMRIYSVNAGGQPLQDLSYTYDSAGNILTITDALNTSTQTFKYDALNRLTQAIGSRYGTKNYQYDPIGNITVKENGIYGYAAGGAGAHAVTSVNDAGTITTMTYDANGNMATKQKGTEITYFDYDVENRLIKIQKDLTSVPKTSAKTIAQYFYDGDGGRVKKIVGSNVTRYVGSLYEETNGVRTRHIYVGDMKVASVTGAQQMYYHTDHLGGTNVVTDKVGVKKELTEYEPYGQFSRRDKYGTGAEVANFYFTGQKFDEESGLYYYGARFYDPMLGRFITADTIVQAPGNGQTFNRYAYCGNNPVNNIDPTGHIFGFIISKVIQVIGSVISTAAGAAYVAGAYVAANAAVIATGAAIGGAIGGVSSVAMGGNFWQGVGMGAIGGGVFAGLTPAFSGMMKIAYTGTTKVSLIGGARAVSNVVAGALGGAASGAAAVAAYAGGDVGEAAWQGAAIAGTLSTLTEANRYMRTKMIQQSRKNPLNIDGKSGGGPFGDDTKIAGTRALKGATKLENCGPLGGCQGGQGEFFGIPYKPDSVLDYVHESFAGPHDYLSSLLYDAQGNGRVYNNAIMRGASFSYSVGALPVAAPFAAAPIITQNGLTPAASIYGISSWSDEHQYNSRDDNN